MFPIGHILVVNNYYVSTIKKELCDSTLGSLGFICNQEITVIQTGKLPDAYFIKVIPKNIENMGYNGGKGITLYFPKLQYLMEAFVDITAEIVKECKSLRAFNNTPKLIIPAFHLIKIICFSKTVKAHIIELYSIDEVPKNLGITEEKILPGLFGRITEIN